MYPGTPFVLAAAFLLEQASAGVLQDRDTTCSKNVLAELMVALPAYAAPFCKDAVNVVAKTPINTITVAPTV